MLEGFLGTGEFADAFEVRLLLKNGAQPPADARIILDDADGDFPTRGMTGGVEVGLRVFCPWML